MDVKCPGTSYHIIRWVRWELTISGSSRLFRDHNCLLACPDGRFMWRVFKRLVPTNWWKGTANRRFAIPVLWNDTGPLHVYRELIPSEGLHLMIAIYSLRVSLLATGFVASYSQVSPLGIHSIQISFREN